MKKLIFINCVFLVFPLRKGAIKGGFVKIKSILTLTFVSFFALLNSDNIYFGPGQQIATFAEAFEIAKTGDHLIEAISQTYSFEKGFNWLSFDVLERDEGSFRRQTQYMLDPVKYNMQLGIHENLIFDYQAYPCWVNGSHIISSPKGYKIEMDAADSFIVDGYRCPANTIFELESSGENWIGYFLDDTQNVYDAFDGFLDDITKIAHQDWSVTYNHGWPDVDYTLSAGDMVVVSCAHDIEEFCWADPAACRTEPFIIQYPRLYTYTEEADYIPIYIELDENDLPDEIAVFVNDECVGARVVQHPFENVCTYITEVQSGNIEIEFAYYGRGSRQRYSEYTVYDSETGYREVTTINLKDKQENYYLSFNSNPGNGNTQQPVKLSALNSPNPFNPSTTISYNMPIEDNVELAIYNLKGQKVKVLANGIQAAGNYSVIWDGKDNSNKPVSSGVYFYQITTSNEVIKKKMLLLK